MKIENIPGIAIGVVICLVILSVVAIPIIDSLPANDYTYAENDTGIKMTYVENPTLTIDIVNVTDGSINIKIGDVTISDSVIYNILSSEFAFGYGGSKVYLMSSSTANVQLAAGDKIVIDNGSWTFTPVSGSTLTGQIGWILFQDENGDWMRFYQTNAKVSKDSTVIVSGFANNINGVLEGNTDGVTSSFVTPAGATMTATLNKTPIEGGLSYYMDCSLTSVNGSGVSTTVPGILFAPLKYKVESNSAIDTIIDIIPVVLVVSLLMGVASIMISRRD